MTPVDVLVLGQTPPPIHGQAVMIERLLSCRFERVRLRHVPMVFSKTTASVGKLRAAKMLELTRVIRQAREQRGQTSILYYPPAGPNRIPFYRDVALLLSVRTLFPRTVFHFHAGGLTDLYARLFPPEKLLFRRAYDRPDGAIVLSEFNPEDGVRLHARRNFVIPYGIEDHNAASPVGRKDPGTPVILFVASLIPSKGVMVLLEAAHLLQKRQLSFRVQLMGGFANADFETEARSFVEQHNLEPYVDFLGIQDGAEKWRSFERASIFCFPTFYEAETFGVVLLEAMQFALPLVATRWRGVQSIVRDGENGYLVEPRDPRGLADALGELLKNPERARAMGQTSRQVYLREYTLEQWALRMEQCFLDVASLPADP